MTTLKHFRNVILFFCLLAGCLSVNAQYRNTQKEYDIQNSTEQNFTLTTAQNSGFFVVVSDRRSGGSAVAGLSFIRLDECLDTLWTRHWEDPTQVNPVNDYITAFDVEETEDAYVICGKMWKEDLSRDVGWVMVTNHSGLVLNFRYYSTISELHAITEVEDPEIKYITCGKTLDGAVVHSLKSNLSHGKWYWKYAGNNNNMPGCFYDITKTMPNQVAVTGQVDSLGNFDVLTASLDYSGGNLWARRYGAPNSFDFLYPEIGKGLYFDGGSLYICGQIQRIDNTGGGIPTVTEALLLNADIFSGNLNWSNMYDINPVIPPVTSDIEMPEKIIQGSNFNLFMTGNIITNSGLANVDGFLLEVTPTGDPVNVNVYDRGSNEYLFQIKEDEPGNFVMAGFASDKLFLIEDIQNAASCSETTFTPDSTELILPSTNINRGLIDTLSHGIMRNEFRPDILAEAFCDGCRCSPTLPLTEYYHVIDTAINNTIHKWMNEGDYFDDNGKKTVLAQSISDNNGDIMIIVTTDKGELEWAKVYGTANKEEAFTVRRTNDDGFIVLGTTEYLNGTHPFLLKLNNDGSFAWSKIYATYHAQASMKVIQLSNDNYVVITSNDVWPNGAGTHRPSIFITDPNGNRLTYHEMNDSENRNWDHFIDLMETSDGNILVVGRGGHNDDFNPGLVIKFDFNLNIVWQQYLRYVTPTGTYDLDDASLNNNSHVKLHGVEESGGYYYVTGVVTNDNDDNKGRNFQHILLMALNTSGGISSYNLYQNTDDATHFFAYDLRACSNGDLLICGSTRLSNGNRSSTLMRTDAAGGLHWAYRYSEGFGNQASWVWEEDDGHIHVNGQDGDINNSIRRAFFMRVDANGEGDNICRQPLNITTPDDSIHPLPVSYNFIERFPGVSDTMPDEDLCFKVTECYPGTGQRLKADTKIRNNTGSGDAQIYPNPSSGAVNLAYDLKEKLPVSVVVYDIQGKIVSIPLENTMQPEGAQKISINNKGKLKPGIYYCVLKTGNEQQVFKLVLTD